MESNNFSICSQFHTTSRCIAGSRYLFREISRTTSLIEALAYDILNIFLFKLLELLHYKIIL